jgi:hypothetical protein
MIHLSDTPIHFPAVMGSIRLKLTADRAPGRLPIRLAHESILQIEALQSRLVERVGTIPGNISETGFEVAR